jgi:excisionase family DNA binding protein
MPVRRPPARPARPPDSYDGESLLTAVQAAEWLQVHRNTVFNMMNDGRLHWHQVGRQRRIHVDDLAAFLKSTRV